jgi:hypothetical protein
MTSSARTSTAGGIVNPNALTVLLLMTSSNFVGCSTGRSAGRQSYEASAVEREEGAIYLQQTVGAADCLEPRVEVVRAPDRDRLKLHAQGARCDLGTFELHRVGRIRRIPEHSDSPELGNELSQELQALPGEISRADGHPLCL